MRFYVSKCHDKLNGITYNPETITPYICVNPYYNVTIDAGRGVSFIIDSGAFQDVGNESRLTFEAALQRQLDFEKKISKEKAEAIVSYDRLVDEQVNEKGQFKQRVNDKLGAKYVKETIEAAEFLVSRREDLAPRKLILSCQGTSAKQYLSCIRSILKVAEPSDIIGFGGFCILSKSADYEREYYEVLTKAFPMIHKAGISRVHIFGMGVFRALVQTDIYGRMNGIECSYDTSSPEMNSVFGKSFNPIEGQMNYVFSKIHKGKGYHPAELALMNTGLITHYWEKVGEMKLPNVFTPCLIQSRKPANDKGTLTIDH